MPVVDLVAHGPWDIMTAPRSGRVEVASAAELLALVLDWRATLAAAGRGWTALVIAAERPGPPPEGLTHPPLMVVGDVYPERTDEELDELAGGRWWPRVLAVSEGRRWPC